MNFHVNENYTYIYFFLLENRAAVKAAAKVNLPLTTQLVLPSYGNELLSPKLSEPRHLFSLQPGHQAPRWPAECQVNT